MMVCLTTINLNNLLAYVQPLLTFPLDGYFCSKLKHSIFTKHSSIKKEILTTNFLNQTYANLHFVLSSLCFCLRYLLQLPGMSSCFDQTLCKKYTSQCMTSLLLVALVHVYLALFFFFFFQVYQSTFSVLEEARCLGLFPTLPQVTYQYQALGEGFGYRLECICSWSRMDLNNLECPPFCM